MELPQPEQLVADTPKTQILTNQSPLVAKRTSHHNITSTAKQIAENIFRSNSTTDTCKFKCTITSERLAQLKKTVDDALKEHQVFIIKGGWQTIRTSLLSRNWVEKYETVKHPKPQSAPSQQTIDDLCSNLPSRQAWETTSAHIEKCEKTIMSRLLQIHDVDFYWNMRRDQSDWQHRINTNKVMNRFNRSLYTSKEGLCLLLQQMYWHVEPGLANVNFPRCYVLGFPDHYNSFVDDFRLTACMGMLKFFVNKMDTEDEFAIKSPDGKVSFSALQFAMNRLDEFIECKKHLDIDKDFPQTWDHEWDQFLTNFHRVVHQDAMFLESKEWCISVLHAAAKLTLLEVSKYWPQFDLDGMKNIWIMKPGNKCRGRGIQLIKNVEDVARIMNMKLKYVIQKYIEKPLIIYQTKFDIRQWFLITSVQPLTIWMYRESYLRFSSQIFTLDNFHESLHLTNHAVQCKYTNMQQRDKALPDDNMWDCYTFKAYLKQIGHMNKWDDVIYPGMRQTLIGAMLACQDTMDRRPNTFELYGADFILAEDFTPWLLEINSSPDLSNSTSVTSRMCPQCVEDLIKVVIDKRKDPKADTGMFELIYRQNFPRPPAYLGMSLTVRGKRVFKNRAKRAKSSGKENDTSKKESGNLRPPLPILSQPVYVPKPISVDMYDGPIIGDLIEELSSSFMSSSNTFSASGVDIIPSISSSTKSKKKGNAIKPDRVSKSEYGPMKTKTNKKRSLNRRSKGNASIKNGSTRQSKNKRTVKSLGLFNEWSAKNKYGSDQEVQKGDVVWEKETTSILKGKNILSKFHVTNNNNNNKETCQNAYCLNSIGLNSSLPQISINTNSNNDVFLAKNFLTVGLNFRNNSNK